VGERVTQRYREEYARAVLAQEVGWFDTAGRGGLATRVSELTARVKS
jgi:ABC-type multidrug transport system fused ATPase/permease subunit